jgi:hypothetical protein
MDFDKCKFTCISVNQIQSSLAVYENRNKFLYKKKKKKLKIREWKIERKREHQIFLFKIVES